MMGRPEGLKLIDENGRRIDGRKKYELRPIKMEVGVLKTLMVPLTLSGARTRFWPRFMGPGRFTPNISRGPRGPYSESATAWLPSALRRERSPDRTGGALK